MDYLIERNDTGQKWYTSKKWLAHWHDAAKKGGYTITVSYVDTETYRRVYSAI